jgi:hypothetical protein
MDGNAVFGIREVLKGPGQSNSDLSIGFNKVERPTEANNLNVRALSFNVLNPPPSANPLVNARAFGFGVIRSTSASPRLIQFALKCQF